MSFVCCLLLACYSLLLAIIKVISVSLNSSFEDRLCEVTTGTCRITIRREQLAWLYTTERVQYRLWRVFYKLTVCKEKFVYRFFLSTYNSPGAAEPLIDWGGGGKSNIHYWRHVIKEAWSVGGASTHRRFRHLNVHHTSEPVDYCPRKLGGEKACMYMVLQLNS